MDILKKAAAVLRKTAVKILFVFGLIYDLGIKIYNSVSRTEFKPDKEMREKRIMQFAVSSAVFYVICNSGFVFAIKSIRKVSHTGSFVSSHFMFWDVVAPISFTFLLLEVFLSFIVGMFAVFKLHTLYRMKNDAKDLKGDNKFMEEDELGREFYAVKADNISAAEKSGMLIGEKDGVYYIEPDTVNIITVGATRSGKDQCYVLPSMRLMAYSKDKPSIIANDMKGDMLEQTYTDFVKNGYKVLVLDLVDTDRSMHWNPLQVIIDEYLKARKGSGDLSDTSKLVGSFAHCLTDDEKSEAVWTDSSRSLLCAMIYYFLDRGYEKGSMAEVNMYSIYNFFLEFGTYNTVVTDPNGQKKEVNALDELFSKLPIGSLAKQAYTTSKFSEGETRSSIFTVLSSKLEIFGSDMGIQKLTAANEINFYDLVNPDQPCIIYMVIPHEEKSRHVIASMFVDQCYMHLAKQARYEPNGKYKRKVEFILNEFGQMPLIPGMAQKLNVCAGCNILFNLFLQDFGQLKRYKDEEDSITGGCGIHIYISSQSNKTNKYFSESIGNKTVDYMTYSGDLYGFVNHKGGRIDGKALLDPTQLARLPFGSAVVKKQRCDPIITVITPYYKIKDKPARIPRLQLPFDVNNCDLQTILFPFEPIWDSLGELGMQYRLDKLQGRADELLSKHYQIMKQIERLQNDGENVPEELYQKAREYELEARSAQMQVIDYREKIKRIKEHMENEKRRIFADAYGMSNTAPEEDYPEEDYGYTEEHYEYSNEIPYIEAGDVIYKLNMLTENEFDLYLTEHDFTALRSFVKKIQKRPDVRKNFTADEWTVIENYINDEEFKYANT